MAKRASTTSKASLPVRPKTDKQQQRMWAAESALNTIRRADEIRRDPKLMADAKALAAREMAALQKVAGKK